MEPNESQLWLSIGASAVFHVIAWAVFNRGRVDVTSLTPIQNESAFEIAKAEAARIAGRYRRFNIVPLVIIVLTIVAAAVLHLQGDPYPKRLVLLGPPSLGLWCSSMLRLLYARHLVHRGFPGLPPEVSRQQFEGLVEDQMFEAMRGDLGKYIRSLRPWIIGIHFLALFMFSIAVLFAFVG